MKSVPAIKKFFEAEPHGRKVTMDELKALSKDERAEIGRLCCDALGEQYEEAA